MKLDSFSKWRFFAAAAGVTSLVRHRRTRPLLAVFVLALAFAAWPLWAAESPKLTGFFSFTKVTDLGPQVRVALHIRLISGGDSDVSDAAARIVPSRLQQTGDLSLPPVNVRAHGIADLQKEMLVSRAEWQMLQQSRNLVLQLGVSGTRQNGSAAIVLQRNQIVTGQNR